MLFDAMVAHSLPVPVSLIPHPRIELIHTPVERSVAVDPSRLELERSVNWHDRARVAQVDAGVAHVVEIVFGRQVVQEVAK